MKTKLTKNETVALLANIQRVLETGKPWEDKNLHHPVEAIVKAVLSIKGMKRNPHDVGGYCGMAGFDTNGWQWDWCQTFTYKGKEYTLSGSGYYGGHTFCVSD